MATVTNDLSIMANPIKKLPTVDYNAGIAASLNILHIRQIA